MIMRHYLKLMSVGDASDRHILTGQKRKYRFSASEFEAIKNVRISDDEWNRVDGSSSDDSAPATSR